MKSSLPRLPPLLALAALLSSLPLSGAAPVGAQGGCATTRGSVASDGTQANASSSRAAISADGRF
ncbi:MAG TPA: hypothetical protein VJO15_09225, partial [Dehalococcoidia bacterium]|nr:hypothetical protein [Dehalococcoidia bacterium]